SVVAIFYVASFLLLGILFVAPFLVLTLFIILKKSYILSQQQQKLDELNVITRENLIGIKSIRAFRQSQYETSRFSKVNHKYSFFLLNYLILWFLLILSFICF
ncbi:MAG: ABC transporter transmembrane domain-containing protein, partial [Candidatus Phytoplasma sp. TWB_XP]